MLGDLFAVLLGDTDGNGHVVLLPVIDDGLVKQ
jgi:hypothetical protein